MFLSISVFELRYQVRNPVFWIASSIFFLLSFAAATVDRIQIGSSANVHVNSPYALAQINLNFLFFFMFVTTAFVANVVVRDDETGYGPIIRATRIRKAEYLYGRFLGHVRHHRLRGQRRRP